VNLFVVDASVAAKWVLPGPAEPFREQALHILKQWLDGKARLIVPDFFWVEMTNVLWKAVRRGRCTNEIAIAALATLVDYGMPTVPSLTLLNPALQTAVLHGRSAYDCLYIVLAREAEAHLVTADKKLANAMAAHFPVRWLGAI
jgi:predicted nucleic acid-binding protein